MFGPAFLVNPVTEPAATTRHLYLPKPGGTTSGPASLMTGEQAIDAPAPRWTGIPLYIRAGSILPLGPEIEWSTEKPADPIELRVYRGADGDFTLYEDENDTYNYEKGAYATIPLMGRSRQTLTIGDRQGEFPGMLGSWTFRVVFVGGSTEAAFAIRLPR